MKFGFFLTHPSKPISSIKIIVTHRGKRYTKALGYSIPPAIWDKAHQRIVYNKSSRRFKEAAMAIMDTASALQRVALKNPVVADGRSFWAVLECEKSGRSYDAVSPEARELSSYFRNIFIPRFMTSKSQTRVSRFNVVLKVLESFEAWGGRVWDFDSIDQTFFRALQEYSASKKYTSSYYNGLVQVLSQVIREAAEVDRYHANPVYSRTTSLAEVCDSVYLNDAELDAIYHLTIDEEFIRSLYPESLGNGLQSRVNSYIAAKNLFLIGAHTGLRVSDFKRLRREHITSDNMIVIVTAKTSQRVVIPIKPVVRDILNSGFDLGAVRLSEQKMRSYIKVIARCAGIVETVEVRRSYMGGVQVERKAKWELVSTHTARRSFATNAYKAGVPTIGIMKITGHTKESTFMKYIRVTAEENAGLLANHPYFN